MVETSIATALLQLVALVLPAIAIAIQVMTDFGDRAAYQAVIQRKPTQAVNLDREDVSQMRNPQKQSDIRYASLSAVLFVGAGILTILHLALAFMLSEFGISLVSAVIPILYFLSLLFVFLGLLTFAMAVYWMRLTPKRQQESNIADRIQSAFEKES